MLLASILILYLCIQSKQPWLIIALAATLVVCEVLNYVINVIIDIVMKSIDTNESEWKN